MKPISLIIKDFCAHSESKIDFNDFNCALIIGKIRGNDKQSNGSGKSTIFSAINYVLFNETDYASLDDIIRKKTNSCSVSFDFISSLDDNTYRIIRSRNKKTGSEVRLFKLVDNNWEDITARTNSHTEQEIQKILKINYKTFCNSSFFGQSDLSGIASLTPSARKKILKSILQLDIYNKYEVIAKKKTSDILKEIDKYNTILQTIGSPEEDIKNLSKDLLECSSAIENKNDSLSLLKEKHSNEALKHSNFLKELESFEKDILEYNSKYKLLENEFNKSVNAVKEYEKKVSLIKENASSLIKESKDLKLEIFKIDLSSLRNKEDIKKDIDALTKNIIDNKALINSINAKLIELKIPLPSGGNCKHCRRIITEDESRNCKEAIEKEIIENNLKLKNTQETISILLNKDKELKQELQQTENINNSLINKKQNLQNKEKEIESKKQIFIEFNDLLEKSIIDQQSKKQELAVFTATKPEDNSNKISNTKINISNSKNTTQELAKQIDIISKEMVLISNKLAILNHKIEQRTLDIEKIKNITSNISVLEKKYSIYNKVVSAFGSKGIPALITQTILDDFMYETNCYLTKLHPGIQMQFITEKERSDGDLDDTLDMEFLMNNDRFQYQQLSGAQKLIVALALRLGLSSVLTKRLGVSMQLLLIDEVDQCLDDLNIELFEEAIKKISQEMKVLIITHNKELKSKFNTVIVVEQDENFVSTAKVSNEW